MVKIYSTSYNRPDFIVLQNKYLNRYCTDDFKFYTINNGHTPEIKKIIHDTCVSLGVECIIMGENHLDPSTSHFNAMNYVLNEYIKKDNSWDITVIMDSDIFPFKKFSFEEMLGTHEICGMYQQRCDYEIEYLCGIFMMFSNKINILELDLSRKQETDTGGRTSDFMKQNNIIPKWINHTAAIDVETDYIFQNKNLEFPYRSDYKCQFISGCLLHYYRGGNWDNMPEHWHIEKTNFVNNFLDNPDIYNIRLDDKVHYDKAHSQKGWNGVDHNYNGYKFIENKNI